MHGDKVRIWQHIFKSFTKAGAKLLNGCGIRLQKWIEYNEPYAERPGPQPHLLANSSEAAYGQCLAAQSQPGKSPPIPAAGSGGTISGGNLSRQSQDHPES